MNSWSSYIHTPLVDKGACAPPRPAPLLCKFTEQFLSVFFPVFKNLGSTACHTNTHICTDTHGKVLGCNSSLSTHTREHFSVLDYKSDVLTLVSADE